MINNIKKWTALCVLLIVLFLTNYSWADERTEPVDFIIALDKSLSMKEEIDAVKEYINSYVIDENVKKDDYILVISFFGNAEVTVSTIVEGQAHIETIKQLVSTIKANGEYTDIGIAMDKMQEELKFQEALYTKIKATDNSPRLAKLQKEVKKLKEAIVVVENQQSQLAELDDNLSI